MRPPACTPLAPDNGTRAGREFLAADATLPPSLTRWLDEQNARARPRWLPTSCRGVQSFGPEAAPTPPTGDAAGADAARWANASFADINAMTLSSKARDLAKQLAGLAVKDTTWNEELIFEKDVAEVAKLGEYLDEVIQLSDALVAEMQGVLGAVAAFRKELYAVKKRPMTTENLDTVRPLLDDQIYEFLRSVAEYGVRADIEGEPQRFEVGPHKSARVLLEKMLVASAKEFRMGVAFIISDKSKELAKGIEVCPMGAVSKKSPLTRVILAEPRPIHNVKWGDKGSLNSRTIERHTPPTVCPSHMDLAQQIVMEYFVFPGVQQFATKRDILKAFRWILSQLGDTKWFSTLLPTLENMDCEGMIQVVLLALPFGWRNSPGLYGIAGWAMTQVQRRLGPGPENWLAGSDMAFYSTAFVDDAVLIEPMLGRRLELASDAYVYAGLGVLNEGFLQLSKMMEEGRWTLELMPWGRWLDMPRMPYGLEGVTFELPEVKIAAACELLDAPSAQPGARRITYLEHTSLFGNAIYWAATSPAMKVMVMGLSVMSATRTPGWIDPVGTEEERAVAWEADDGIKLFLQVTMRDALDDPSTFKC